MARIHRGQWPFFLIPAVAILILLPVALVIGFNTGEDNDTEQPDDLAVRDRSAQEAGASAAADEVRLVNFAFEPAEIDGRIGQAIVFRNDVETVHQVRINAGTESEQLKQGDSFEWVPDEAGTYEIVCAIHPNDMTATVEVSN